MINAGRIRMVYPENKAAADHFENLRSQYAEGVQRVKGIYLFIFLMLIQYVLYCRVQVALLILKMF